jgi:hypothetical protein
MFKTQNNQLNEYPEGSHAYKRTGENVIGLGGLVHENAEHTSEPCNRRYRGTLNRVLRSIGKFCSGW